MKRQLYSALIMPDDNNKRYIRASRPVPYPYGKINPFGHARELYIAVTLVPLQFSKQWGNQHHKGITVVQGDQIKPFEYNIFKRTSPLLFSFLEDNINKWLLNNEFIPTKPLDLNIALPGKIVEFDLGKDVYVMTRLDNGKLIPATIAKRDPLTNSIEKHKIVRRSSRLFLYGIETDTPDLFIERAKKQILSISEPVNHRRDITLSKMLERIINGETECSIRTINALTNLNKEFLFADVRLTLNTLIELKRNILNFRYIGTRTYEEISTIILPYFKQNIDSLE